MYPNVLKRVQDSVIMPSRPPRVVAKRSISAASEDSVVTTVRGASQYLVQELKELGITGKVGGPDWVTATLNQKNRDAVLRHSLLAIRVMHLLGRTRDREALREMAKQVKPVGSFAVRAVSIDRQELQEDVGGDIKDATNAPVNLTKPDTTYLVLDFDGEYLFGIDRAGELGKRHYKIITGAQSLSGPVAAAILYSSGWTPEEDIVAWPCATGELAIEAALLATGKSPRAYELRIPDKKEAECRIVAADAKLAMVSAAQKNAKIAGIHTSIKFSRQDLDWLDTKHDEREVRYFVGLLPNLKLFPGFTKELFYQLDYILGQGGKACFACVNDESAERLEAGVAAAERRYETKRDYLWSGQQALTIVILTARGARKNRPKPVAPVGNPLKQAKE